MRMRDVSPSLGSIMLIPIATDAPIYHWPISTLGLIVANISAFVCMVARVIDPTAGWVLIHGKGISPEQWVLSAFVHIDLGHLIGNMIFLELFGTIVEGKLGWWRFLACYLGIGVAANAIEQLALLGMGGHSGSVGASTAIFGIMAMALVWAPYNNVMVMLWTVLPIARFELTIGMFTMLYIGFDVVVLALLRGAMSTSWLHVIGALLGFPLAAALLKFELVDCEGWDLFNHGQSDADSFTSIRDEKRKMADQVSAQMESANKARERQNQKLAQLAQAGSEQVHVYLEGGNSAAAEKLMDKLSETGTDLELDPDDLTALIRAMHKQQKWAKSAPLMAKLIKLRPERADPVRLKLAQICVVELERPGRALDLLGEINLKGLPAEHQRLAGKISQRAQQMQAEGHVELDDGGW